ncbi:MAG: ATP phosphoribosyltransferase regulatory subunit [Spirochaetales bacterium]|nr:ATP phosphoribosyltransferase regulatory subunit [Spirochaetales bacterium]
MKNNLLRLPQGTESLYLEETFRHRKILRHMEDMSEDWGYLPVQTPVFDFYDNYRQLLDSKLEEQTYKMIDREGDLMMLRSDITLFLARQMGMILSEEELPLRVHYSDSILRYQDHEDISSHEFFQAGCELIGKPGREGDLEILFLLAELLRSLKLPESRIHVGSTELFKTIAGSLTPEGGTLLKKYLQTREEKEIRKTLGRVYKKEDALELSRLLLFIGSADEFTAKAGDWEKLMEGALKPALDHLRSISSGWKEIDGFDELFNIDLSETGDQAYYAGIVFNAYTEGSGTAVASGGRYDGLLDHFGYTGGKPASSVGFSLFLRKLEKLSAIDIPGFPETETDESISAAQKLAAVRKGK